jgi:hypothetical protein
LAPAEVLDNVESFGRSWVGAVEKAYCKCRMQEISGLRVEDVGCRMQEISGLGVEDVGCRMQEISGLRVEDVGCRMQEISELGMEGKLKEMREG